MRVSPHSTRAAAASLVAMAEGVRAMNTRTAVALLGVPLLACAGVRPAAATRLLSPSRVDTLRVAMPELGGRERTVRVYLPPGYADGDASYPVLYFQDGQQLFSPGYFGDWRIDETLDRLTRDGWRGLIVVGVDNSEHRWDEYGPWTNDRMHAWVDSSWAKASEGGDGDAYVRFLANTLKPEIDRRYRTERAREHTGIGGSSMGGVLALWAGLTKPEVFSKVMAMSTAVWFAEGGGTWLSDNRLLAALRTRKLPADVRFYLDVGSAERSRDTDPDVVDAQGARVSYSRAYVEGSEAVATALVEGGVSAWNVKHVVARGALHNEDAWSRRFEDAVTWLYQR